MNAVTFDTLKFARTLQADGTFTDAQSERLVEAFSEMLSTDLASKGHVGVVRHELGKLDGQIRKTERRLEAKLDEAKTEIIQWFCGVIGIQTVAIIIPLLAFVRFAPHG